MVFSVAVVRRDHVDAAAGKLREPDTYGIGFHGGKPFTGLEQNDAFAIESGKLARQLVKRGMPPSRLIAGACLRRRRTRPSKKTSRER